MIGKTVLILGAGFSEPAGVPLVHDFFDRAKELYLANRDSMSQVIRKSYEDVINYRREKNSLAANAPFDLDDIENLFSILELEVQYLKPDQVSMRKNLILMIVDALIRTAKPRLDPDILTPAEGGFIKERLGSKQLPEVTSYLERLT